MGNSNSLIVEPLPCPFCGQDAEYGHHNGQYAVECHGGDDGCHILPKTDMYDTVKEAIEAWNERVPASTEGSGQ